MEFLDKVKMFANLLTTKTYTITSTATGHNTAPEGVVSEFYISDATNSGVGVIGKMVSGVLVISDTVDGSTMPVLTNPVTIVSSIAAQTFNRRFFGRAGVVLIGQSQIVGYNFGKDLAIEYPDPNITEFIPDTEHEVIATEPLDHTDLNTSLAKSDISMTFATHYAKQIRHSGVQHVELIARGKGSTGFIYDDWNKGDFEYEAAVLRTVQYLQAGKGRYLHSIIMSIGETDASRPDLTDIAGFSTQLHQFIGDFRADVLAATGVNISKVPMVFLGMSKYFIAATSLGPGVEGVLADISNQIPYTAYVETASYDIPAGGAQTTLAIHHSAATQRLIGTEKMFPGYEIALSNPFGDIAPEGPNTGTIAATIPLLTMVASGNAVAPRLDNTGTIAGTIPAITMVAAGNAAEAPQGVTPDFLLKTGVNVLTVQDTSGHTGIAKWTSTIGSFYVENTGTSFTPVNNVAGAEYTGPNDGILNFPGAAAEFLDNATGLTIAVDCTPTAIGTSDDLFRGLQNNLGVSGTSKLQGTSLTHTALTNNVRTVLTLSLDRAGDTLKAYAGGIEIGSMTGLSALAAEGTAVNSTGLGSIFSNGFEGIIHNVYIYKGPLTLAQANGTATASFA